MADQGKKDRVSASRANSATNESGRIAFLDQALWQQFRDATTKDDFARSWLALQCRMLEGVTRGMVIWESPEAGYLEAAAHWPENDSGTPTLLASAQMAMAERRGVAGGRKPGSAVDHDTKCEVAYPFMLDDRVLGAVALEVEAQSEPRLRSIMRGLQWGVAWVEVFLRRHEGEDARHVRDRMATTLDTVAGIVEQPGFHAASEAVVTELASRLGCERVSVGFVARGHAVVSALSHTAQFGNRMKMIRAIGAAMDEAIDQASAIVHPAHEEGAFQISRAHGDLADGHGSRSIFTAPFAVEDDLIGAFTFERGDDAGFDAKTMELCELIASIAGPILDEKRRNDRLLTAKATDAVTRQAKRLFGAGFVGRKLAATVVALLVLFFALVDGTYRVTAPARLEGLVQRVIVAPFDGYVRSELKRAGDTVKRSEILAHLDDRELALQHFAEVTKRSQHRREYDRALAERKRAEANIIKAQIEQASAQIALLSQQLARTRITAPFDGIVVSGDLSQSVGAPVARGDVLFELAPLNDYRVILEVDESEISEISADQSGTLLLSALSGDSLPLNVANITPVSEARDGRNYFRVEARLGVGTARLRPGMKGIAKVTVDERRLIWIWTHGLLERLRLWLWSWWP